MEMVTVSTVCRASSGCQNDTEHLVESAGGFIEACYDCAESLDMFEDIIGDVRAGTVIVLDERRWKHALDVREVLAVRFGR
jgi:hypothetical protein